MQLIRAADEHLNVVIDYYTRRVRNCSNFLFLVEKFGRKKKRGEGKKIARTPRSRPDRGTIEKNRNRRSVGRVLDMQISQSTEIFNLTSRVRILRRLLIRRIDDSN